MNLKCATFLFLSTIIVLALAAPKESLTKRNEDEKPDSLLSAFLSPVLNLVRSTTTRTTEYFKDAVAIGDTHISAARDTIVQIAAEIGRNALGTVFQSTRRFRGDVKRFLDVVKSSQTSLQDIMDNEELNGLFRASLMPLSMGLATLEGQVTGLDLVVNSGKNNIPEAEY